MSEEQKTNVTKWLGGSTDIISRWHESYNRALFMIAKETQTPILDITTPFDTFRGDISSLYCADGIHPNIHGHRMYVACTSHIDLLQKQDQERIERLSYI